MADIFVRKATILDGSGGPPFTADILVDQGVICEIGRLGVVAADHHIAAEGLVACPGFIDIHSHTDFTIQINASADSKIFQGVTSEVVGQCGISLAPIAPRFKSELIQYTEVDAEYFDWDWQSFADYLEKLRGNIGVNLLPLVGHGSLRIAVMGFASQPPTAFELRQMQRLLMAALDTGAVGMSSGLIYPPGCYAATEELIELAKTMRPYGGIYFTHLRNEAATLIPAIQEALRIGREAGVQVQLCHLKAAGRKNWHLLESALELITQARRDGLNVWADIYPYTAANTSLTALLPNWCKTDGISGLLTRLSYTSERQKIREDIEQNGNAMTGDLFWEDVHLVFFEAEPELNGLSLPEIADHWQMDPLDALFELVWRSEGKAEMVYHFLCEENIELLLKFPFSVIGSDSSAKAPYGVLGRGKPHPRAYGTFPRVIDRYVRQKAILDLPTAVKKMTGQSAAILGCKNRGELRKGQRADIVIFDPETIRDRATFNQPHLLPLGIYEVILNGKSVVRNGAHLGLLSGVIVSKGG